MRLWTLVAVAFASLGNAQADPIAEKYRERFLAAAAPILEELERFKSAKLAAVTVTTR